MSDSSLSDVRPAEAPNPRHRRDARVHRPAAIVTGAITAGALALATFAAMAPGQAIDTEGVSTTLNQAGPQVGTQVVAQLDRATESSAERLALLDRAHEQFKTSATAAAEAGKVVKKRTEEIEAERRAAEQAAAERRAAEEAAAEQAAAEQRAAEEQAAAEQRAASRSNERAAAPAPAPAASGDPRSIARSMLSGYGWGQDQFGCLDALWQRESNWNPYAQNPSSGAYGIPQSLPGNKMASAGSDWQTNPATQIRWGLGYISSVYGSPCGAWAHSQSVGWY